MDSGIIVVIVFTLFVVVAVTWLEISSRRKKAAQSQGAQSNTTVPPGRANAGRTTAPAHPSRHNK